VYVVETPASDERRDLLRYDSPAIGPVTAGGDWRSRFRPRSPSGCALSVVGLAVIVLVVLLALRAFSDGDDGGTVGTVAGGGTGAEASASAAPSGTAGSTAESTPAAPDRQLLQTGEAVIDIILWELYVTTDISEDDLDYIEDQLLDFLDSISGNRPTFTSSGIDLRLYGGVRMNLTDAGITEAWANTIYECGASDGVRVIVCPANVEPMPAGGGDVWMFAMAFADAVPQADTDHSFVYSIVFDSDGDPANDWRFNPPFDFDLFQGADRWYQLVWNHTAGQWLISTTQVNAAQQPAVVPSAVRAVIEGDTIVFFIPASEFALDQPPYRMTSFGHDGNFSEADRGADVSGVDPTAPLTLPSADVYLAMPEAR